MPNNYKKLKQVPTGVWYSVINKSGENMKTEIMELIDSYEQFELSDDLTKFKRLNDDWLWDSSQTSLSHP
jgi:hypothetical protein